MTLRSTAIAQLFFVASVFTCSMQCMAADKELSDFFKDKLVFLQSVAKSLYQTLTKTGPNPFVALPLEVRNHIATYLEFGDRESDADAVTRVKKCPVSVPHWVQLMGPGTCGTHRNVAGCYTMDRSKLITVDNTMDIVGDVFIYDIRDDVIDMQSKRRCEFLYNALSQEQTFRVHGGTVEGIFMSPDEIAVSRDGSLFAEIELRLTSLNDGSGNRIKVPVLSIWNTHTKEVERCDIAHCGQIDAVGFNKQGTKLVIHHTKKVESKGCYVRLHHIMPLVPEAEHAAKSVQTFDWYLQHRGICKGYLIRKKCTL